MQPANIHMVRINVSGFTKAQVEKGLRHLLDEFTYHPWLYNCQAHWDDTTNKLVIVAGSEFEEKLEDSIFDEISDCVLANMNFDKKIELDIQRI